MDIQVVEIRLLQGKRPLKAFADIKVKDWIIHDFRIVKQDRQRASVLPPQVSWKDPVTGAIKFKGILTIPSEQKQLIEVAILAAFQKEMKKGNGALRSVE
jgi:DNA-binding cell septation regulator SpoVG